MIKTLQVKLSQICKKNTKS